MEVEQIYSSVYQDVYRFSTGVVLLVNKFNTYACNSKGFKTKRYYSSNYLKVLQEDNQDPVTGTKFKKGTVMYEGKPVRLVNQERWTYELKIAGGVCVGNADQMKQLANNIITLTEPRTRDSPSDDWITETDNEKG